MCNVCSKNDGATLVMYTKQAICKNELKTKAS